MNTKVNTYYLDTRRVMSITENAPETPVIVESDKYQEALLRRVWLALFRDNVPSPFIHELEVFFRSNDLVDIIRLAAETADYILFGGERPLSPFARIARGLEGEDAGNLRRTLTLLRFPKRYTPVKLPNGLTGFWETNARVGNWHACDHVYITDLVRKHVHAFLTDYRVDRDEWSLSTGSDADGSWNIVDKLYAVERFVPDLLGPSLGTPIWNVADGTKPFVNENRMKAIPKNYKSVRHIAMEPQWMSVLAQPVAKAIERCLPPYANIHDQSHNVSLAQRGSIDNSLATVDLSAASDSNSKELCEAILPKEVYCDILAVTSRRPIPNRDRWGQITKYWDPSFGWVPSAKEYKMISTMGNRVTFPLETLIFSAILEATAELIGESTSYNKCGVYGDDIICPNHWVPTLFDVLAACGYLVNTQKSFYGDEYYRESCGGEYFHGETVSSIYWPREAITEANALFNLVPLQHKVYGLPYTNEVIVKEIRRLCPKITQSFPGSVYDDIWSEYPDIKRAYGSYANKSPEESPSCEIHTVFETRSGRSEWNEGNDRLRYYQFLRYGHRPHPDPVLAQVGVPAPVDRTWGAVHPASTPKNRKFLV